MATIAQRQVSLGAGVAYRSVWSATLRAFRIPILAWGIGLALVVLATAAASPEQAATISSTVSGKLADQLMQEIRFFGDTVALDTPQGYTTLKALGWLPVLLGVWTAIAGAHLTRGDEERGALDLLLGEPLSRARVLGEKLVAFALGTLIISLLVSLGLMLGLAAAKLPADPGGSLLVGLNLALSAFVYGALGLFFSQFTRTANAAAGIAGAYMAFDYVFAGAARSSDALSWLGRLTINFYSELSKPIIPTYGANPGAMLVLLAMSVALVATSFWLFLRRDVNDVVSLWSRAGQPGAGRSGVSAATAIARAEHDRSLSAIWTRALAANRMTIIWWIFGIGVYAVYGVFIAKATVQGFSDAFRQNPILATLFNGDNMATNSGFVSGIIFTFVPFVSVLAAIFFALNWASDLDHGQLETTLGSAPLPRWRVPLERFVTVVVGVVGVGVVTALAGELGAASSGLALDFGGLLRAGLGLIPLGLLAGALVFALAGRLNSGTILGLVGGLASLSFILELLRGVLNPPPWVLNLSIFHLYDQPMVNGINWTGTLVMLGLAVALLAYATYAFTRADVRN